MKSRSDRYNEGKRYVRPLEPWEMPMPWWMVIGSLGTVAWICVKIASLVFS